MGANHFQKYPNLFTRLVANTIIPDGQSDCGCWRWTGNTHGRSANSQYGRFNQQCRGKRKKLLAHRAILVLLEVGEEVEFFFDLYELYSIAGFEADHLCEKETRCINPEHLQWLSKEEHRTKTNKYRYGKGRE